MSFMQILLRSPEDSFLKVVSNVISGFLFLLLSNQHWLAGLCTVLCMQTRYKIVVSTGKSPAFKLHSVDANLAWLKMESLRGIQNAPTATAQNINQFEIYLDWMSWD